MQVAEVELQVVGDGLCKASGRATYATGHADRDAAATVLDAAFEGSQRVQIDLSGVDEGGSVVLSLMLSWLRQARHHGRELTYANVTPELMELIKFTGLDGILLSNGALK